MIKFFFYVVIPLVITNTYFFSQGMQQHSKALTAYQKALELDPSNGEALEGYRACSTQLNSNPEEVR